LQATAVRFSQAFGDDYACHFLPYSFLLSPPEYGLGRSVPMRDLPSGVHSHNGIESGVNSSSRLPDLSVMSTGWLLLTSGLVDVAEPTMVTGFKSEPQG
jgi:hypothetical protein